MAANSARRVVELWSLYARLDGLLVARNAKVAVAWYASDLIVGLAAVTATFLLAERFDGIGTWSKHEVSFLLGYGLLVRGATNTLFSYNVAHISRRIGRGQLDHLLLQPQPLWMALLTEGFAPLTGAGMLVPGLGLLVWSISQVHAPVGAAWLALLGVDLSASVAIVMAFGYAWACLAFVAPRAAEEVNSSTWRLLMELQSFPLDSLPGPALVGLLTVVPVGLVAWYPSRSLLGLDPSVWAPAVPAAAALVSVGVASAIFVRGLRHYARTGSSRYLDYGHRR